MINQIMDLKVLSDLIAKTFGSSKFFVRSNNGILTIAPLSTDNHVSTSQEVDIDKPLQSSNVDKTKAGALTSDDFKKIKLFPKGFKFDREEANIRK
jgi:hypothetical protein